MKEAFFKHGEKEALRSCVRAISFCSTESQGELQDFARNQLKELEDELIAKLKAAIKEVAVCFSNNHSFFLDLWWVKCDMFQPCRMVTMNIHFL